MQTLPFPSYSFLTFYQLFLCTISECPFWLPFLHLFSFFISPLSTALLSSSLSIHLSTTSFHSRLRLSIPVCVDGMWGTHTHTHMHSSFSVRSLLALWKETLLTLLAPSSPPLLGTQSYDDVYLQVKMREAALMFDQFLNRFPNKILQGEGRGAGCKHVWLLNCHLLRDIYRGSERESTLSSGLQ